MIDFAERLPTWSRVRAWEIASAAEPLVAARGRVAAERLLGMANWFLGRRAEAP